MTDVTAQAETSEPPKKVIVLIESDIPSTKIVTEAVASLPGYTVESFSDFGSYSKWLSKPADQRGTVKLFLLSTEALGNDSITTWTGQSSAAELDANVPLILTTFGSPKTSLAKFLPSGAFNLMIKPLDLMLLKRNFQIALADEDLTSESAIFQMQTQSRIESLKSVPMTAISEVGFITHSDREVPQGRSAKYYGDIFAHGDVRSLYARMFDQKSEDGAWKVRLTFFGPSREQMLRVRSHFPKTAGTGENWLPLANPAAKVRFLVIADPSPPGSGLSETLSRNFLNVDVLPLVGAPDVKFNERTFDAIFVHRNFFPQIVKDDRFKACKKIVLTEQPLLDSELRDFSATASDIVFIPMERVSFFKKLQALFPGLSPTEERPIQTFERRETLDVGQPVEMIEMSEVSLTERYERAFDPGTVRRFILWHPTEKDTPVLTGRCYKSEKDPSNSGAFLNYFIFFGISDHESKHIRLWMRDQYILAKSGG